MTEAAWRINLMDAKRRLSAHLSGSSTTASPSIPAPPADALAAAGGRELVGSLANN
jgi:hypothetical protein